MDAAVNAEMRAAYGYNMAYPGGLSNSTPNAAARAVYGDLLAIFRSLHAVINNGPNSIGGGGVPRIPTKPPICPN